VAALYLAQGQGAPSSSWMNPLAGSGGMVATFSLRSHSTSRGLGIPYGQVRPVHIQQQKELESSRSLMYSLGRASKTSKTPCLARCQSQLAWQLGFSGEKTWKLRGQRLTSRPNSSPPPFWTAELGQRHQPRKVRAFFLLRFWLSFPRERPANIVRDFFGTFGARLRLFAHNRSVFVRA
jgi:hypothetical protein